MYERLRLKLLRFFEGRDCICPEDLADKTIDRVARKLGEGEKIRDTEPAGYFYGVARNILREYWGERARERTSLEKLASETAPVGAAVDHSRRHECLDRCLTKLPPESRELLLTYYQGQSGPKIENRRTIAVRLGIPLNALRLRMHRLRAKVEACAYECMKETAPSETNFEFTARRR